MQKLSFKILSPEEANLEIHRLQEFYTSFGGEALYPRPPVALLNSAERSNIVLIEDEQSEIAGAACLFRHPLGPFETEADFHKIDSSKTTIPHYLEFGADLVRPDCQGWQLHLDLISLRILLALMEPPQKLAYAICEVKPPPPFRSYSNYCACQFTDEFDIDGILQAAKYEGIAPSDFPGRYKCVSMSHDADRLRSSGKRIQSLLTNPVRTRTRDGMTVTIRSEPLLKESPLLSDMADNLAED